MCSRTFSPAPPARAAVRVRHPRVGAGHPGDPVARARRLVNQGDFSFDADTHHRGPVAAPKPNASPATSPHGSSAAAASRPRVDAERQDAAAPSPSRSTPKASLPGNEAYTLDVTPHGIQVTARRTGRPVLRRGHAVAVGHRRRPARRHHHRRAAYRGRAALRLARPDARRRPALPQRRRRQGDARPDGAAQAQLVALAPDRRPGLAHRDQAVPEADRSRRLPHSRRRRRPQRRRHAASVLRLLHPGRRSATWCATRPSATSPWSRRSTCPATRRRRSPPTRSWA